MQNQLCDPPISSPSAGVDERQAWVRQALSQRAQACTGAELERLCKTLKRLEPAAAAALSQADALGAHCAADQQSPDSLRFLQTLRGLTS
jgi:hypothetical protein